jgi:hypothetical protein
MDTMEKSMTQGYNVLPDALRHYGVRRSWRIPYNRLIMAVPWLKRLIAGLSPWRLGFAPGSIHAGFVADKVALGQDFLLVFRAFSANIIPPVFHIHLSPPHEVCDSSDQAEHYHHLGPKLGGFISDPALWLETKLERKKR